MAISRGQLVKELEPGLNALFGLEYKRYANQHAEIYSTESSDRAFKPGSSSLTSCPRDIAIVFLLYYTPVVTLRLCSLIITTQLT